MILVPAYNEAERVAATVEGLRRAIPEGRVIVVDDGSADGTARLARDAGAVVESMSRNMGKGNALNEAFERVSPADEDILLFVDADLGLTSAEASALLGPVLSGEADMTVAKFRVRGKGGFGLAKNLARWGIRRFGAGFDAKAPLSGQRAMRAGLFKEIGGLESGYGMEIGLTINVLRRGGRIQEIEVDMADNETGRDLAGWRHRGRQFWHIARVLAKELKRS